jgi:hypothetical protein
VKALFVLLLLLLLIACSAGPVPIVGDREGFVASDVAADAPRQPAPLPARDGLSSEEEGSAALLVSRLERAREEAERNEILHELIRLGPRYLPFLRGIEHESLRLDIMYVIRSIEREHSIRNETPPAPEVSGSAGEAENPYHVPDGAGYNREHVERWLEEQLDRARRELDAGRHESAARIADAAVLLMPDSRLRPDFETVASRARGEGGGDLLIAGTLTLEPRHLQYASQEQSAPFAEPLQIRCYLKNVSGRRLTLRINEGPGRESVLLLTVSYEQSDYLGAVLTQSASVRIPIDAQGSVTLAPNESYELVVPLAGFSSLDPDAPLKLALGKADIQASLRVFGASGEGGQRVLLRPIQFARQSVLVFPAGFNLDAVQERPVAALREFMADGRAQELFLAAHVVEARSRRAIGDLLTDDDFETAPLAMQRARLRALQVIFNRGATWDIRAWRNWWSGERTRN